MNLDLRYVIHYLSPRFVRRLSLFKKPASFAIQHFRG